MASAAQTDVEEIDPKVFQRFEIQVKVGRGAYGVVWKCYDRYSENAVAVKKIFDAFQNATDAQRTYREVLVLRQLAGYEHVVNMTDVMGAVNDKDLYLVFDLMPSDLHAVIRECILTESQRQFVMYQIAKCLKYLHSARLVHRDMKPANILIDEHCHMKLADFGLARSVGEAGFAPSIEKGNGPMTDYVATRWYRAPEILLGSCSYTRAVDMWSFGCVWGETLSGKPLFPGASTMNQLDRILELTDKPSFEDIQAMGSPYAAAMLEALPLTPPRPIHEFFPLADMEALHLLYCLLQFNPNRRYSAIEILEHPYLCVFHDDAKEPVADRYIDMPVDDNTRLDVTEYRKRLYEDF